MHEDRPLMVTIRCITYNHEKYIRQTLEGFVMQQTTFRFEAIVHDDASTDGTAAIVREYAERYPDIIKPIYETENQYSKHDGSITRIMAQATRGKYVASCEGDDYWTDPLKLQKQYEVMEAHPECSLCVHKVLCVNEDGSPHEREIPDRKYPVKPGIQGPEMYGLMLCAYLFQTSSFFYRRSVMQYKLEHSDLLRLYNGDIQLLRSAFCVGAYYYLAEPMSVNRVGSIEGWNYKQSRLPWEEKTRWYGNRMKADFLFNEHVGRAYTEVFRIHWIGGLLGLSIHAPRWAKQQLVRLDASWSDTANVRKKHRIYYLLLMHCYPVFYLLSLVRKLKDLI